jgi:hypothetical protein
MRFRPLEPAVRDRLRASLRRNVSDGAALLTGVDTSFLGDLPTLPDDEEVIRAIKSVPCHYGENRFIHRPLCWW